MVHLINIVITFLRIRAISFLINVVSDLKFGHFYFSWPPLTAGFLCSFKTKNLFTLTQKSMFDSSHSASSAYQKWPTKGQIKP